MKRFWLAALVALTMTGSVLAGDFDRVATLTASGEADAKEVSVNRKVSKVRITCTEGSVIINTFVVRRGSAVDRHTVAKRFGKDDRIVLDIGDKVDVTGFRISDDGKGTYVIAVSK